jgi:Thioredoxin
MKESEIAGRRLRMRTLKMLPLFGSLLIIIVSVSVFYLRQNQKEFPSMDLQLQDKVVNPLEKLDPQYLVKYGDENAPLKIVEFFSFQCPHCIKIFREDFDRIKREFIDTGKIYFEFHPVPNDLSTLQALICFESLDEKEKRLFLEVILEEVIPFDSALTVKLMMAAMNVFKKPLPALGDLDFLNDHDVFQKSHHFLAQEKINAVPTVEINGLLFANEIPNYQFIKLFVKD